MFSTIFLKTFPQLKQIKDVSINCIINMYLDISWVAYSHKFKSILVLSTIALKRDLQMFQKLKLWFCLATIFVFCLDSFCPRPEMLTRKTVFSPKPTTLFPCAKADMEKVQQECQVCPNISIMVWKRVIRVLAKPRGELLLQLEFQPAIPLLNLALNELVFSVFASQSQAGISFILNVGLFSFVSSISFAIEILLTFINKVFHILSSISLPPNFSQIFWGLSENDSHC